MISKRPGLGEVAHESRTGQNPTFGRIPISFEQEWVKNRFSDISYYGLKYFEIEQLPLINETCLL